MSSIKLQGDTSGEITIAAPAVAGTNTITLPASTGTMITSDNISDYSSSSSLTQDINIASGETCTAGKALSLNSSGEVGAYPPLNTVGSDQNATTFTAVSKDGTRGIVASITSSDHTQTTYEFTGYVISKTSGAVVGSTTQSVQFTTGIGSATQSYSVLNFVWSGDKNFVVVGKKYTRAGNHYINIRAVSLDVDASGNVSKGTLTTLYSSGTGNVSGDHPNYMSVGLITGDNYSMVTNEGNTSSVTVARSFTRTGSTFTNATDGTEAVTIVPNMGLESSSYTSNNIMAVPNGTSLYTAPYTTNNIGTVTTTTGIISDNVDAFIYWANVNSEYAIAAYKNTDGETILRSFSINQTTGAMTSVSTHVLYSTGTYRNFKFAYEDSSNLVFTYKDNVLGTYYVNSIGLSSGTISGTNTATSISSLTDMPIRYTNTTKEYLFFHDSVNVGYTVQAYYNPDVFQFGGFVNSTTSTSPATVVVNGIASGFTGLTTGSTYYASTAYDGTLTTSSASEVKVGVALSSTTLHIRY